MKRVDRLAALSVAGCYVASVVYSHRCVKKKEGAKTRNGSTFRFFGGPMTKDGLRAHWSGVEFAQLQL